MRRVIGINYEKSSCVLSFSGTHQNGSKREYWQLANRMSAKGGPKNLMIIDGGKGILLRQSASMAC